jgi:nicotinamidase-related amidase
MQALIIIDVQNEFSANGKRPVPDHLAVIEVISRQVKKARANGTPIAWVRHFNQPHESPAFVPGTWGAEFTPGLGPKSEFIHETEFKKDVYGAFTGTNIGNWLKALRVDEVLIMGFYTHGCVSTTAREAITAGLQVYIPASATGACDMHHEILGEQTADEVRRSALLHLANMGAVIIA